MHILTTPDGVRVGIVGRKKPQPAPTLLVFATSIEQTLSPRESYNKTSRFLMRRGYISVSLDVPCHGHDLRPGETGTMEAALADWRKRIEQGDALVDEFVRRVSSAISFLVDTGWTDAGKIAACGTSRGGFMAMHVAAADERVRCAAGLSPVTSLLALREFAGSEDNDAVRRLDLRNFAGKLADKSVWIAIGNNDTRVGTDHAVDLARKIAAESLARGRRPMVELHVTATQGHSLPPAARREAAKWIAGALEDQK